MCGRSVVAILGACGIVVLASIATLAWVADEAEDLGRFHPGVPVESPAVPC